MFLNPDFLYDAEILAIWQFNGDILSPSEILQKVFLGGEATIFDSHCIYSVSVSKKTSPTFLAVTLESIVGFS